MIETLNKLRESGSQGRHELTEINDKLSKLLDGQRQIIQAIGDLRLFISREIFNEFQSAAEKTVLTLQDRYNFLIAGGYKRSKKKQYSDLADQIQDATNFLGTYDFSAFYTFSLGLAMSLALRRTVRTPERQMVVLERSFKDKMDVWLTPSNDRGIIKGIQLAKDDVARQQAELTAFVTRPYQLHSDTRGRCHYTTFLDIQGSFEQGFTGRTREVQGECYDPPHNPCPRNCLVDQAAIGGLAKSAASKLAVLGNGPDYVGIPTQTDGANSPFDQVREANSRRSAIIRDMRRIRDLEFLKSQIERVSAALGTT